MVKRIGTANYTSFVGSGCLASFCSLYTRRPEDTTLESWLLQTHTSEPAHKPLVLWYEYVSFVLSYCISQ